MPLKQGSRTLTTTNFDAIIENCRYLAMLQNAKSKGNIGLSHFGLLGQMAFTSESAPADFQIKQIMGQLYGSQAVEHYNEIETAQAMQATCVIGIGADTLLTGISAISGVGDATGLTEEGGLADAGLVSEFSAEQSVLDEEVSYAVKTPYGEAIQSTSEDALAIKNSISNGGYVYRAGQFGQSNTTDAQFWAAESPLNPGYADRYGVYYGQQDYIIRGTIKPGSNFITRPAPAGGLNSGGGIEIVTQPDGVNLDSFYMP